MINALIYVLTSFIFGLLIPYIARRFAKFMPATAAYAIYRIFKPCKGACKVKKQQNYRYAKLLKAYRIYSIGWAVVCMTISYLALVCFGPQGAPWYIAFIWILLLLFEIDKRMFLLPDLLTIPLLIIGFCYAAFVQDGGWIPAEESALGAAAGYLLPTIAGVFIVWRHKDAFGGGDVKLLSAVGAWLGIYLVFVILLSCIIFAVYALINRKKSGAFGPAIVISSLAIAFIFFSR